MFPVSVWSWVLTDKCTMNNQHILTGIKALYSPPLHTGNLSQNVYTVCKAAPTQSDPTPDLPSKHPWLNFMSLTIIHAGWQIGFWRRRAVESRIDEGFFFKSLLFSLKLKKPQINLTCPWSQITTQNQTLRGERNGTRHKSIQSIRINQLFIWMWSLTYSFHTQGCCLHDTFITKYICVALWTWKHKYCI